jgi:predicted  nucleic acid-binding Zn-ribbon protein
MTNDEYQQLIEFLGRKFEEIDRRFDRVEAKLAEHDERFREIFGHFDHLYRRLERLEQEYQAILEGLRRIERWLIDERGKREVLEQSLEHLKREVAALQTRIQELEQRIR